MNFQEFQTENISAELPNGTIIQIEVSQMGRENVGFDVKPFKQVTDALEGIAQAISIPLERIQPDKASVKFGLEVSIDAGQLTAVIVKGSSKANLEITLEWTKKTGGGK
jgi:Trypsin-co-occurring domain 1